MTNFSKKLLTLGLFIATLSHSALYAFELKDYPRSYPTKLTQESADGQLAIEDAYHANKYVGGTWTVITFSVPDADLDKEVYLVADTNAFGRKTLSGIFTDSEKGLSLGKGNLIWIGSEDGRAHFVMIAPSGGLNYELYVKTNGTQYSNKFRINSQY